METLKDLEVSQKGLIHSLFWPWFLLVPLYKVKIELVFFFLIVKSPFKDYISELLRMFLKDAILQ